MMIEEPCWKIVYYHLVYERLLSLVHGLDCAVEYKVGEYSVAHPIDPDDVYARGGLLAFGSLAEARDYHQSCGGYEHGLYVYYAMGVGKMDLKKYPMRRVMTNDFDMWKLGDHIAASLKTRLGFYVYSYEMWPNGTVMYEKIKLVRPATLEEMS